MIMTKEAQKMLQEFNTIYEDVLKKYTNKSTSKDLYDFVSDILDRENKDNPKYDEIKQSSNSVGEVYDKLTTLNDITTIKKLIEEYGYDVKSKDYKNIIVEYKLLCDEYGPFSGGEKIWKEAIENIIYNCTY